MMIDDQPAFIDFEASSLDLIASYPIEVGVCLANGEVRSWLIEPHVLWQDWSDSAGRNSSRKVFRCRRSQGS